MRVRTGNDAKRSAADSAGKLIFRLARRQVFESGNEQAGVLAIDDGDRTGLAPVPIFFGDNGAVPTLMVKLDGDFRPILHLYPVNRCVYPAFMGIAHDDERTGADERAAI